MMQNRLIISRLFLPSEGIMFVSIGEDEQASLKRLLDSCFGEINTLGTIVWKARVKPVNIGEAKYRPQNETEYVLAYEVEQGKARFRPLLTGSVRVYPHRLRERAYRLATILKSNRGVNYRSTMTFEIDGYEPPEGQRWQAGEDVIRQLFQDGYIEFRDGTPFRRYFEDEEGAEHDPFYCFMETEWSGTSEIGKTELNNLLGNTHGFDTVKPTKLLKTLISSCTDNSHAIMDFFAGSGTTAHAVVSLNREGDTKRKYVVAETGKYFDTLLKARVQKIIYSKDWKDGKPISREGSSHLFKYVRLESYEDALNNLELKRTEEQASLLEAHDEFREDYMLHYMLDVEASGSASLLNIENFADPFNYQLNVATSVSVGETRPVTVDLVETFNYLLGLRVKQVDAIRGFRVVEGTNPEGEKAVIIWRNTREKSNDDLDQFFKKQRYNTRDRKFDIIYTNGDNNLENLKRADETWKVRLIEEEFQRLMFDVQDV